MFNPIAQDDDTIDRNNTRFFGCFLRVFGSLFVVCSCVTMSFVLIAVFGINTFRESEPARLAMVEIQSNSAVIATFGEPIEMGWFVTGSLLIEQDKGNASLKIPISGSLETGILSLDAKKLDEDWYFQRLVVVTDDGDQIVIQE